MKKIFYLHYLIPITLIIYISSIIGCTVPGYDTPPPPACDNQVAPFTLALDFSGTTYLCTSGSFGSFTPPNASGFNYLTTASANATIGSLSNSFSYLCQITCKNDQPSENPNNPCSNPGTLTYTWNTPGTTLAIQDYKNHNSDITVDYYDICATCSSTIPEARPFFVGVATIPAGVSYTNIPLQTQQPYVGKTPGNPCE